MYHARTSNKENARPRRTEDGGTYYHSLSHGNEKRAVPKTALPFLNIYKKYRTEQKQVYIDQINEIFETEYSQPESHTHLQFAQSQQHKPKIAK